MPTTLIDDLRSRGLIKDCSDEAEFERALSGRAAVYAGFDPTASSLHAGHLLSLTMLKRFADAGHIAVPVIGTATGLVGDPSGRTSERPLMDEDDLLENVAGIEGCIKRILGQDTVIWRNGDWLKNQSFVGFLRDVGRHVTIPHLLALDSVRSRLDGNGSMSFMEFSYSLLQASDFHHLARQFPVMIQIGGSDQWGNICMGLELIRKSGHKGTAIGFTHPLLTKSDGDKMGKTAGKAVWLDPALTTPFDFFQFWRNTPDAELLSLRRMLTDAEPLASLPSSVIELNHLKEDLAFRMTALVHGAETAQSALEDARKVFGEMGIAGLKSHTISIEAFEDFPAVLVAIELAESKSAARRLIGQRGIKIDGVEMSGSHSVSALLSDDSTVRISAGKKRHVAVHLTK